MNICHFDTFLDYDDAEEFLRDTLTNYKQRYGDEYIEAEARIRNTPGSWLVTILLKKKQLELDFD